MFLGSANQKLHYLHCIPTFAHDTGELSSNIAI